MTLAELSIRRHVFAFMLNAVLVLFGLIAYTRMGVDKLPYIEFPVISITTVQKGANPEVIERLDHQSHRVGGEQRARHRAHPVDLKPRRVGGQRHVQPRQAHRRRV
ncbi:MAG: efflux RND transporter permease subunit [Burkholderiales bacterium]|nr:efflux RND transporter permease subunit [Burkholderiales bacterium]MDW8468297.1 efflux RND transporter permease subunit [Burkholderiales bacterium]